MLGVIISFVWEVWIQRLLWKWLNHTHLVNLIRNRFFMWTLHLGHQVKLGNAELHFNHRILYWHAQTSWFTWWWPAILYTRPYKHNNIQHSLQVKTEFFCAIFYGFLLNRVLQQHFSSRHVLSEKSKPKKTPKNPTQNDREVLLILQPTSIRGEKTRSGRVQWIKSYFC